jgi:hypothetical protein
MLLWLVAYVCIGVVIGVLFAALDEDGEDAGIDGVMAITVTMFWPLVVVVVVVFLFLSYLNDFFSLVVALVRRFLVNKGVI